MGKFTAQVEDGKMARHVDEVCKIGQGNECCRYLAADYRGLVCIKLTSLKAQVDRRVATETMVARGDNCDGQDGVIV